jgi:hypothetical protein
MCVVARQAGRDAGLGTGLVGGGVSVAGVSVAWYSTRRRRLYAEIVAGLEVRATEAAERRVTG